MTKKKYSDLIQLETFEDRFEFLKVQGKVGEESFGFNRFLNQNFYKTKEWRKVRDDVIIRDKGRDLGIKDRKIEGKVIVHHIQPMTMDDIINKEEWILDPDYLICVSDETHKAIHYGDSDLLMKSEIIERKPNDTCPWK